MNYKILEINKEGWIKIEVKFDGGEVYKKKMMAPIGDKKELTEAIENWLKEYSKARVTQESVSKTVKDLVGKTVTLK